MKGYKQKGRRFSPNKKVKCKFKSMYHPMEHANTDALKTLNRWGRESAKQETH